MRAWRNVTDIAKPSRNELVAMIVVAALVLAGVVSAGLALSRDVFSASAFVSQYLRAIAGRDVATALSMPGVLPQGVTRAEVSKNPQDVLLTPAALVNGFDFDIVSDDAVQGVHYVTVHTSLSGDEDVVFSVSPSGTLAGLFAQWTFTTSPLGSLSVTTRHSTFFSVNGFGPVDMAAVDPSVSPQDFEATVAFPVFVPGAYTLQVTSSALTSKSETVSLSEPGSSAVATLTAEPTPAFVERVQSQVNEFFDDCVSQHVLLPAGCPFGVTIENRVSGKPTWGVASYPTVELRAGASGWEIVPASMGLTFDADIQSLFDGSITPVHEDVALTIGGRVVLTASGDITVLIDRID